jgi:hypothetical protein
VGGQGRHDTQALKEGFMGAVEEANKTAQTVIEAFKQTPAVLALVIFNCAFMALVAFGSYQSNARQVKDAEHWRVLAEKTLETCRPKT